MMRGKCGLTSSLPRMSTPRPFVAMVGLFDSSIAILESEGLNEDELKADPKLG